MSPSRSSATKRPLPSPATGSRAHDLNDLVFFARVVEHGGFSAAARVMGIQTSSLSRRLQALEERLGVRLLQRSTRRISVTDIGQRYLQHCVALIAEAQAAQDTIEHTRAVPQGLIRLSCPVAMLQNGVGEIVSRYLAHHPLVEIQVEATNRRVEVIEEGFDIALRVRSPPLEDSGLVVRILGQARATLVASKPLIAEHGMPVTPDDLDRFPSMGFGWVNGRHSWEFVTPTGQTLVKHHNPRLMVDDFNTLRRAALDGVGVVNLPRYVVQAELDAGTLVEILADHAGADGIAHAVFPSRRGLVPAVRGLIDALADGFAKGCSVV
jgi:DNA-binding transcriptional LysR family regulator